MKRFIIPCVFVSLMAASLPGCSGPAPPAVPKQGPAAAPEAAKGELPAEPQALDEAVKRLKDADAAVRLQAAIALAEAGQAVEAAAPVLIEAAKDKDAAVRGRALVPLGRIGTKEAVAALAEALGHEDPRTRAGAAQALRIVGARGQAAVPALARALQDKDRAVKGAAVDALASIGPAAKEAVPALSAALRRHESLNDLVLRGTAAKALGRIGPDAKDAVPTLIQAIKFVNDRERSFAKEDIELLAAIEAKAFADLAAKTGKPLKATKSGKDANAVWKAYAVYFDLFGSSRAAAADALKNIDPEAAKALAPGLIEMLKDKDAVMRYCGASALGCLGRDAGSAVPALIEALKDNESRVRSAAADALKMIEPKAAPNAK